MEQLFAVTGRKVKMEPLPLLLVGSDVNNQLVSYDYVVLYRSITNLIIIAPGDYIM